MYQTPQGQEKESVGRQYQWWQTQFHRPIDLTIEPRVRRVMPEAKEAMVMMMDKSGAERLKQYETKV